MQWWCAALGEQWTWNWRAYPGVWLFVVAVAAAGLAGGRTATYPEGSPEAALQAHLVAFQDGDYRAAYEQLSSNVRVAFTYPQYLEMASSMGMGMSEPPRVTIDRVLISGERATIDLGIEYPPSGGLFPSRYRQSLTVRLVREAGVWRINQKMFGASGMY